MGAGQWEGEFLCLLDSGRGYAFAESLQPVSGFFFFNVNLGLFINWKGCFSFTWVH